MKKCGFDLTEMHRVYLMNILKNLDLPLTPRLDYDSNKPIDFKMDLGWIFENKDIKIIMANNPITGKYYNGARDNEKNYCSYIGIEGDGVLVDYISTYIFQYAEFIKDFNNFEREYI